MPSELRFGRHMFSGSYSGLNLNRYGVTPPCRTMLYCLRLRRFVLIFVNPLTCPTAAKTVSCMAGICGAGLLPKTAGKK
ncbi:TPA: hypothetical protein WK850_001416 [Neisseria gonorrhoeae]|nr:hypothetical protein [Neisseria gonorrhoeae]MCF3010885.1 hypothetical protein [Neisseria gonorrhoeae]MCH8778481.1 hypothetical protein [Neisseria gonorrhoeae]MCU9890751.1 hypothetical protein [Neisseria gonorrhoeae]MDO6007498.1 hypothetical protein [Neisseria gonorrhoeae]